MNMFENEIHLDTRTVISFTQDIHTMLYMGTTYAGEYIHPTKSNLLECWQYCPEERRDRIPSLNPYGMAYAILYAPTKTPNLAHSFYQCASPLTLGVLHEWMMHLHRQADYDLHLPRITLNTGGTK